MSVILHLNVQVLHSNSNTAVCKSATVGSSDAVKRLEAENYVPK